MIYHRARSGKRKILIPTTGQRAKRRRLNPFNVDVPFNVKDVSDAFKKANALQKVGSAPPSTKPDYYCPVANKCEVCRRAVRRRSITVLEITTHFDYSKIRT